MWLPEGQVHTGEIEAELDALRDDPRSKLKPTIAMIIFSARGQQLVLCTAAQDKTLNPTRYFPQANIEPNEVIDEAAVARMQEKLGIIPEHLFALYGLAGDRLYGTRLGGKKVGKGLQRAILPVLGVTHVPVQLHPYSGELATANWYSVTDAHRITSSQPDSTRSDIARTILARFDAWHSEHRHL